MEHLEAIDIVIDLESFEGEPDVIIDIRTKHKAVLQEFKMPYCGGKVVKRLDVEGNVESFKYVPPYDDEPTIDLMDYFDELPDKITDNPDYAELKL